MRADLKRRDWLGLAAASALGAAGLAGCKQPAPRLEDLPGGFSGVALERGHGLHPFIVGLISGTGRVFSATGSCGCAEHGLWRACTPSVAVQERVM